MKGFLIACTLAALVAIATCLTDEQKEILKKNHGLCLKETKVDEAKVTKLRKDKDFSDKDEGLQNYIFCMFTKSNIITPEGKFKKDVALSKLSAEVDQVKIEAAFDACLDKQGKTPQESAFLLAECYHQQKPDHAIL